MDQESVKPRAGPALTLTLKLLTRSHSVVSVMINDCGIRQIWVQILALLFWAWGKCLNLSTSLVFVLYNGDNNSDPVVLLGGPSNYLPVKRSVLHLAQRINFQLW